MLRNVAHPTRRGLALQQETGNHSERQENDGCDDQYDQHAELQERHLPSAIGRPAGARADRGPRLNDDKAAVNGPQVRPI